MYRVHNEEYYHSQILLIAFFLVRCVRKKRVHYFRELSALSFYIFAFAEPVALLVSASTLLDLVIH